MTEPISQIDDAVGRENSQVSGGNGLDGDGPPVRGPTVIAARAVGGDRRKGESHVERYRTLNRVRR
jgi:hypothetical protein